MNTYENLYTTNTIPLTGGIGRTENCLLYMAFGSADFRNEAMASILSYLKISLPEDNITVLIYTDVPDHFKPLSGASAQIICEEVEADQWRSWRGDIDFVHRIKIEVILHAVQKYGANTLFLDSDTYFLQHPAPIFASLAAGNRFMHVYESTLSTSDGLHKMLYKILQKHPGEWSENLGKTKMYNAGVIGLSPVDEPMLQRVLRLTDTFYKIHPSHVMEQLSFSICLSDKSPVNEAAPFILHYWHMKDTRPVLAAFFESVKGNSTAGVLEEFLNVRVLQASASKDLWELKTRWQRVLLRLLGKGWMWPQ